MNLELFEHTGPAGGVEPMGKQAFILRGGALAELPQLLHALAGVEAASPFRHMVTPGGRPMSVALTNCGEWGWVSDSRGYRYTRLDPMTGRTWPPMPDVFARLAAHAAAAAGFAGFVPDACLVNRYLPGSRLTLHQDRNEQDFGAPIVSVSLGIPAVFLFGGHQRGDRPARFPLFHGDVAVWGGADRLRYHGIMPLRDGHHPALGAQRINFTLRKAG
ncbi:MAG: DNA oxidative demethylase AlkB [Pigmentiphaga sp.]|uniref:DNA oxidative demethylase AlkB n=1 Tax=Pigmentiphaga sp. TaxID=1977564 RepID=UPI0029A65E50|nr:DNA oxidative demethylase AlkB [Pigmentiphaga sp.]MDX3905511.1 DNA oxidative demethylase AlkB [Pigmentiphaga sp.]